MRTDCFSIQRQYPISCKLFTPDTESIHHIIIGVHGFAGDKESSMLEKLAETICKHEAALICFDFPAHGNSPVTEELLTINNCKEDLSTVMDYIESRYPSANKSIFATSFGGYISLLCADRFTNMPLVLRAPAVTMPKILLETVLKTTAEDFQRQETIECGFERPIKLPYSFFEELAAQKNISNTVITSPILIIHGDCDDVVPLSDVKAFAACQSNVVLQIIPGADHRFKNKGEIETVIDLTKSFLQL